MCVCFAWLFDADGDLALIDPKKFVLEREKEKKGKRGEFGQDLKEGYKEDLRPTLKPIAPVPSSSLLSRYRSS